MHEYKHTHKYNSNDVARLTCCSAVSDGTTYNIDK